MDVLDDILDTLNLTGVLYFRTEFSGRWAVTVPDLEQAARFHLVVRGECHVAVASGEQMRLGQGDLVLIPRGRSHVLADAPTNRAPPLESVLRDAGYRGDGVLVVGDRKPTSTTQMICGHFGFRPGADHPILRALPTHLVVTAADRAAEPWLDDTLRLVARRVFSDDMGSEAAVTRLSEIVFIELLRFGIRQSDALAGIMTAMRDPKIGRALDLMHARAAEPWTVTTLAREIGMSRSRFAERFSNLLATGPMAYLSEWRLQNALSLLHDSRRSVQQVASQAGYGSPAAFTRAFSGKFGIAPTEYRRRHA